MLLFNTIEGQGPFLYNLGYTEPTKAIHGFNVLQGGSILAGKKNPNHQVGFFRLRRSRSDFRG